MNDVRKDEAEAIKALNPLINQMGIDASERRPLFNRALRAQLKEVHNNINHYLPTAPRGWGDDNQMPHEWGSMDTYDDMRNSMHFASLLMDRMLDPFDTEEDEVKAIREVIAGAQTGLCCIAEEVITIARGDLTEDQFDNVVYGEEEDD